MQNIEIQHLGPVTDFKMEIKDFNLLIGEQATGKSTIAKCIYYFRIIKTSITDYLCQLYDTSSYNGADASKGFRSVLKKELKSIFISLFGFSWDLDERLYLKYEYTPEIWIDLRLNKGGWKKYISVRYSKALQSAIQRLEQEVLELHSQKSDTTASLAFASKERLRNYDDIKNSVNNIFDDYKETYYIPAGRSMITLLSNNRSMIESENLDLITRQFLQIIDSIHVSFSEGIRNVHKRYPDGERKFDVAKIAEILIRDLKGDYQYTPGKEYIIIADQEARNEKVPINFASSGQQEILWLLNQLYILMLKKENAFVIIEEPEAHLYPTLQKDVVDFIAFFVNICHSSVFITTHSPYVLTAANTLYCAGKLILSTPNAARQAYEIIGIKRDINPNLFTAFKINRNGEIQDLVDKDAQEITTELIDEISDIINETYMDLFCLSSTFAQQDKTMEEHVNE